MALQARSHEDILLPESFSDFPFPSSHFCTSLLVPLFAVVSPFELDLSLLQVYILEERPRRFKRY